MKWKKVLSLVLVCALALSLGSAALAAGADDAALQAVTLKVKARLGLDTEVYTSFDGWCEEDLLTGARWTLNWSGDGAYLSIACDDNGKVYSYNRSDTAEDVVSSSTGRFNIPALPDSDSAAALTAAQDFLAKVLDAGVETVELEDSFEPSLTRTFFRFYGTIRLYGVDSPISCSLTVRASDNQVTRFWRGDQYSGYTGELPTPDTTISEKQARQDLVSTLSMEPFYVLQEDGVTARVVYLPQSGDDYYVDGKTGKLVNLTQLRSALWESGGGNKLLFDSVTNSEAAEDAVAPGASLNQVELDGAAKLAGALDKEALDRAIRNAWPEIGLDTYSLAGASYWVTEQETEEGADPVYDVTCQLTYGKKLEEGVARKYVTVNAKTGEMLSLRSYRPYDKTTRLALQTATAQRNAADILTTFIGTDVMDQLALYDTVEVNETTATAQYLFTYTRTAYGYYYRDNYYTVGIDAYDGTLSALYGCFDENVTLVDPGRVVAPNVAVNTYAAALDVSYLYLEVPTAIDLMDREIYELFKNTTSYVVTLRPGFVYAQPEATVTGVDASTGEVIQSEPYVPDVFSLTYDDVEGTWVAEAANTLAQYNVGFPGGSLLSTQTLTQLDMLVLLASVDGYHIDDPTDPEQVDGLYLHCYYLGLVTPDTRNETQTITRADLVKLILDGAGYQKVASLSGIFTCSFSDAAAIPADHYGYAALAQGLGLVRGDEYGAYAATRTATRGEAIAMLYQYMK